MRNRKGKDWTNQKFFKLTFKNPTSQKRGSSIIWSAECDCGNLIEVLPFTVTSGHTTSCGCYRIDSGKKNRKYHPIISSARKAWKSYKDLDFDTFYKMSQQNCFYCGREPFRILNIGVSDKRRKNVDKYQLLEGNFVFNGIDRIDSSKGHIPGNIVTCCWDCNIAKNNLPQDEFLNLIKMIYHNRLLSHND